MGGDFKFIKDIFGEFLQLENIQQMFEIIIEDDINDWEKWFQIEFAFFLKFQCDKVRRSTREKPLKLRKNQAAVKTEKLKDRTVIDFAVERKSTSKDGEILIEIKRRKSVNGCVKGMIHDAKLIRSAKGKKDVRSTFIVGIHPTEDEKHTVYDKIHKHKASHLLTLDRDYAVEIPGSRGKLQLSILQVVM